MANVLPRVAYLCGGCGATLDAGGLPTNLWVACPRCGRPGRPPASEPETPWNAESFVYAEKSAVEERDPEAIEGVWGRFVARYVSPIRILGVVLAGMLGYLLYDVVTDEGWTSAGAILYGLVLATILVGLIRPRPRTNSDRND